MWLILLGFEWGSTYTENQQQAGYEEVPFELKLKSAPHDVLYSEAFKTPAGADVVRYAYLAGDVSPILDEDISRRTPVSQTVVLETFKDNAGKDVEKLKTVFLSKPQMYQDGEGWRQIEYATTTPEVFAMSGAIPYIKRRELAEKILPGDSAFALTSTFYPNPHAETSSVDGSVEAIGNSFGCDFTAFDQAHTAGTGANDDIGVNMFAYSTYTDNGDCTDDATISRAFILFDTSGLTAGATISSAVLSIYVTTKYTGVNDTYDTLVVDATTPSSNTTIQAGDFANVAGVAQSNTVVDLTSLTTGTYSNFTLNSTGLGNISKTGISKYGIREGHDFYFQLPGSSPTGAAISSADTSGTSQDPKLEVTYTVAATFSVGNWFPF